MLTKLTWKGYLALVLLAAAIVYCFVDPSRVKADFYPPDRSFVGPNLVASVVQFVIILIVVALLYPPVRHWIEAQVLDVKTHAEEQHAKIQAKVDRSIQLSEHIIEHHPNIPPPPAPKQGVDIPGG